MDASVYVLSCLLESLKKVCMWSLYTLCAILGRSSFSPLSYVVKRKKNRNRVLALTFVSFPFLIPLFVERSYAFNKLTLH